MAAPARAFECDVCGRPLGAGRLRQGVRVHRGCRREPERPPAPEVAAAADDPELRELFARAAAQARELVGDLERLRSLRAGPQP